MPTIPYNPTQEITGRITVPNASQGSGQAIRALQSEAASKGRMSDGLSKLAFSVKDHIIRRQMMGFDVDMLAAEAKFKEFEDKRDNELSKIPVKSGVDFDVKSKEITDRYNNMYKGYLEDNIRNKDFNNIRLEMDQASKGFENRSADSLQNKKIEYDTSLNHSKLELSMTTAIDKGDKEKVKQIANTYVNSGLKTEAEATILAEKTVNNINRLQDDRTDTKVENLVFDGNYEEAEQLMENYSELVTSDDKESKRNRIFGSSTFNRFNTMVNDIRSLEDVEEYRKKLEDDVYMSEDKHKSILSNRVLAAENSIIKQQKRNYKELLIEAEKGELDLSVWDKSKDDKTVTGIYDGGNREAAEKRLIAIQNITKADAVRTTDATEYKKASKKADNGGIDTVYEEHQELLNFQLKGNIQLQEFDERIKKYDGWLKDNKVSAPVHRQLQRELVKSLTIGLEDNQMVKDMSFWKPWVTNKDLTDNEITIYKALTKVYETQNEHTGEYIEDDNTSVISTSNKVQEWIKLNPNATPEQTKEFIKEVTKPVRLQTLRKLLRR